MEMLRERIADGSLLRLVGKCLHVGVLDGAEYSEPDQGTTQGSVISPLLGNVYLHYVLDLWFEREVRPRLRGKATLVRYADDFVIGFERKDDAERVMAVLPRRMGRYGLTLHADKTRLVPLHKTDGNRGPRSGQLRLSGLHALLAANAQRSMADVVQDPACASQTGDTIRRRVLPAPPASTGQRPACRAHETPPRALQLLRSEWQRTEPEQAGACY